ncbi:MAG TPA: hypothetical protein ENJ30_14660 [Desulfobulbaceae bacterium]|nr:hypothetical protein [Desulfobulbaceae bacterium]
MSEATSMAGRKIEAKQLNMRQIKTFISDLDPDAEPHIIDLVFDDPIPATAVAMATGLSLEELAGDFNQEEIRELLDKVKAVNSSFVGMMERIVKAGQLLDAN